MDLRPSTLDDLGILPTLGWFTREFRTLYSQLEVDMQVDVDEQQIAAPVKTAIYRIVQEAFNNAAIHARASKVALRLRRANGRIELVIQDDGAGFDPARVRAVDQDGHGLGLVSMRERAEVSGGRFGLRSEPGRGTTVRANWPIPQCPPRETR